MRAYDIIRKKRDGGRLSTNELRSLVMGYCNGSIPDSQMSAWLMAVFFRGMDSKETSDFTIAMLESGVTLDLSGIPGVKVDKHSTGGVGDKVTLILAPLLAAVRVPIAKMSGRCLGHTGGTIDKLESIPGFSTELSLEKMIDQVREIGVAIAGQTAELVPADKKIYALRDLTATVDCLPLIAASIMSKKIASGADKIILDVKVGSGAFMKCLEDARELARIMVEIGKQVGRETVAVITDMDQPLGNAVGNSLEVREAIETLQGNGPQDVTESCALIGGLSGVLEGKAANRLEGEKIIREKLANGEGLRKFGELISAQEGDPAILQNHSLLPTAPVVQKLESKASGFVARTDALKIAEAAMVLGAGRGEAGVEPDLAVGARVLKKCGDRVEKGETLAEIHAQTEVEADLAAALAFEAYEFSDDQPETRPLVYEVLNKI